MSEVEKWNIFSQADNFRVQKRPKMREASFRSRRKEAGDETGGELNLTLIFYEYDPSSGNDECNLACLLFKLLLSRCFTWPSQILSPP